jgi:hypothetical protein
VLADKQIELNENKKFKTYDIYEHPIGTIEAVKKGWSWPAFFFTWIWALSKKMYLFGGLAAIATVIPGFIPGLGGWFYFIFFTFFFGLIGNDTRRTNLRKRGFELIATLTGETPEGAIAAFFKKNDKGNRMHLGSQPRNEVD